MLLGHPLASRPTPHGDCMSRIQPVSSPSASFLRRLFHVMAIKLRRETMTLATGRLVGWVRVRTRIAGATTYASTGVLLHHLVSGRSPRFGATGPRFLCVVGEQNADHKAKLAVWIYPLGVNSCDSRRDLRTLRPCHSNYGIAHPKLPSSQPKGSSSSSSRQSLLFLMVWGYFLLL
jgi:hypothetical protein